MTARYYLGGMIAVAAALVIAMIQDPPWLAPNELEQEVVKILLQVLVFALAGGVVKLLLDEQNEFRVLQADLLERLGRAHQVVYRVRRLLESGSDRSEELLGELMDARQGLGSAFHVARSRKVASGFEQARREMVAMRRYLESVVKSAFAKPGSPDRAEYDAFLKWREPGAYETEFKERYVRAKMAIDPSFRPEDVEGRI